ncbi:hypothetical protein CHLNCDRAFT_142107 [Chlorella variabilis]|uniref:SET domain-containing protein n=1 Tax=Chlorella variabilis TaxID=554065 RepID=E1Z7S7_CHLVA|nr:hypothetical protein CHLNCDRAFT_142107 [Chlorella variabilis]EFN57970.1 hypothetical protein CHLNCDRAFT_142107 [Chlorella variabilis]|eukprot:XP_005850072.1 hypothetical protein CHLNCDRAFT_142107 [Chlorella variabilis]
MAADSLRWTVDTMPPFQEIEGRLVIKDFRDEETKKVRPFKGTVKSFDAKRKWYRVVYEDGDSEDVWWKDLLPLLQRAAAASPTAAPAAVCAGTGGKQGSRGSSAAAPSPASRSQQLAAPAAVPDMQQHKEQTAKQQHKAKAAGKQAAAASKKPTAAKEPVGRPPRPRTEEEELAAAKKAKDKQAGKKALHASSQPKKRSKGKDSEGQGGERKAAGKKRKPAAAAKEGAGGTGEGAPKRRRKPAGPKIELPVPKLGQEYVYEPGQEPWRSVPGFSWEVKDEPDLSAAAVNRLRNVQRTYNKYYIQAEVDEKVRVEAVLADQKARGKFGKEPRPANRPDRAAESRMVNVEKLAIRGQRVAGHYPGWDIGSRAYSRSELCCMGFHRVPIAGIDFVGAGKAGNGAPPFATSVMVSGWYQDDSDNGAELWYTGEGGNDLLHGRNQVADQSLQRGNAALQGNIMLGIPVRVTRKQKDPHGHYGCCYLYDGLYDVVAMRHVKGKEQTWVYQFLLRRRKGQGPLLSERVEWGGIAAARAIVPKTRQGVVDLDISRGKEERPVAAIDDTWLAGGADHEPQGDIPPCTGLDDIADERQLVGKVVRGINAERIAELREQGYTPAVQYITQYEFVGRAAAKAGQLAQAVLPLELKTHPQPYLAKLNHAVTQRASKYRLEIFKTRNGRGWGVRSLDTIPQFGFVVAYVGEVYDAEEHEHLVRTVEEQDAEYTFDMAPRPDTNWDGTEKVVPDQAKAEFVACGLRKRNVGAFLNHSCAPNCFVQPVLDTHHDRRCPKICIFASENIAPMTELTLDYGEAYAAGFQGGCKCGAADCISLRGPQAAAGHQRQAQEDSAGEGDGEDGEEEEEAEEVVVEEEEEVEEVVEEEEEEVEEVMEKKNKEGGV